MKIIVESYENYLTLLDGKECVKGLIFYPNSSELSVGFYQEYFFGFVPIISIGRQSSTLSIPLYRW